MEPATVAATPFLGLIASLGSAAAAVFVVYLFMGFLRESAKRQEQTSERLTVEFGRLGKEKSDVIHQVAISLDNNSKALERLESTIKSIEIKLGNR